MSNATTHLYIPQGECRIFRKADQKSRNGASGELVRALLSWEEGADLKLEGPAARLEDSMKHVTSDPLNTLPNNDCVRTGEAFEDMKGSLRDAVSKLKTLRDRLQVKLHLAGMEAKTFGDELAHSVDDLSNRLEGYAKGLDRTVDQGQVQWHLGIMEAKDRWEKTREGASKALQILKEDQQKAEELFQELRLQAKLAKAETRDFLAENKQELNKNLKDISTQSVKALKRMNESIGDILHRLD